MRSTDVGTEPVELAANLAFLGFNYGRFFEFEHKQDQEWLDRFRGLDEIEMNKLIEARLTARKAKNFAEADSIRDKLAAMGIALKDTKDPTTGEIVTTWEIAR